MNSTNATEARIAWRLAWASVLVPLLCWSTSMFDETKFDGSLFAVLALAPIAYTAYKRKLQLLVGSHWFIAALLLGCLPFAINPEFDLSLASAISGLSDRAPLLSALVLAGCMSQWQRDNLWSTMLPLFVAVALACWFCLPQALGWDPPGYLNLLGRRSLYPFIGLNHAGEIVTPTLFLTIALGNKYCSKHWLLLAIPMALLCGFWGGNAIRLGFVFGLLALRLINKIELKPLFIITTIFAIGELLRAFTGDGFKSFEAEYRSTEVRLSMYSAAADKIIDTPFGIGIGQFEHSYPKWRSLDEIEMTTVNRSDGSFRAPKTLHNDLLQAILEFGWLGFLLLLAGCRSVWRNIKRHSPQKMHLYAGFAISFAICALTRSPFNDNLPSMAIFFLATASLARPSTPIKTSPLTIALGLTLCAVALVPASANIRGETLIAKAIDSEDDTFSYLSSASEARPWDSRNWVMMAAMYSISGQYDYARSCFDQALIYHPFDMSALLGSIKLERSDPNGSAARMLLHLETAEKLIPFHTEVIALRLELLTPQLQAAEARAAEFMRQGNGIARRYWLAAELIRAQVELVKQQPDNARRALYAAAQFSDSKRALIERIAKKEELSRQLLTQLVIEVFPQWPIIN